MCKHTHLLVLLHVYRNSSLFPCRRVQWQSVWPGLLCKWWRLLSQSRRRLHLPVPTRVSGRSLWRAWVNDVFVSLCLTRVLLGCWQMAKNAMRIHSSIVRFIPSLQVSHCPHLSSMRQCFLTPLSHGLSLLRAICPLWSLRWRSVHRYQMGCCFTATMQAAEISCLSTLWTDM